MTKYIDLSGQQFGNYRLSRWLGGGPTGDVYLGQHVEDQSEVALKVFNAYLTREEDQKAFLEEAQALRLEHPHIMPLLDCGVGSNQMPFVVMAYAPQGTLRKRHTKGLQMPLDDALSFIMPVTAALQFAHEQQVVHGNIKPGNMLLDAEDNVLLSDFELATVMKNLAPSDTQDDRREVTPYTAPERRLGKPGPASDQYALGVVIYEWLCGKSPFQNTADESEQQDDLEPPPLRALAPHLPIEVEQVVQRALASDPEQRFASVREFAAALEAASQPERGLALPTETRLTRTTTTDEIDPYAVAFDDEEASLSTSTSTSPYDQTSIDFDVEDNPFAVEDNSPYALTQLVSDDDDTTQSEASDASYEQTQVIEQVEEDKAVASIGVPALVNDDQNKLAALPFASNVKQADSGNRKRYFALAGIALVMLILLGSVLATGSVAGVQAFSSPISGILQNQPTQQGTALVRDLPGYKSTPDSTSTPTNHPTTTSNTNNNNNTNTNTNNNKNSNTNSTPTTTTKATPTPTTKPAPTPTPTPKPKPTPTPTPKPIVAAVDGKNPTTYTVSGKTCEQTLSNSHSKHVTIGGVGATVYFRFSVTCHAAWAKIVFDKALPSGKYGNAKIVRINDGKAYTCDTGGNKAVAPGQTSCYTGMVQDNASQTASAYGSYMSSWSSQLGPY